MKVSNKTRYILLVFSILFGSILISRVLSPEAVNITNGSRSYVLDCLENSQYKKADYYEYTGPAITFNNFSYFRIWIDDTIPGYNWSSWATNNTWITGTGTVSDPYIIDHLYIDCDGFGDGIRVKNSAKYFIIQNCWITNTPVSGSFGCGVLIQYARNGIVQNNIFIDTTYGVAFQFQCYKIVVFNNTMISDHRPGSRGIEVGPNIHNSTIKENKMLNFYGGMFVEDGDALIIDGNYIENTMWEDFRGSVIFLSNLDDSKIVRNVLAGAFALGYITVEERESSDNVIVHNYVSHDQGLSFNFNITLSSVKDHLHLSQDSAHSMELENCHNNYIAYNVALLEGSGGGGIPGYEPILILGILCAVSVILLKRKLKH